jgi:hypothetical protein
VVCERLLAIGIARLTFEGGDTWQQSGDLTLEACVQLI